MAKAAKPTGKRRPEQKVTQKPAVAAGFGGDNLSIWGKVSWWSLLAMVFIVPIVMSNWTWLGFKLPLSYDQFDIVKVFFQRVLGLVAVSAWGWHIFTKGGHGFGMRQDKHPINEWPARCADWMKSALLTTS